MNAPSARWEIQRRAYWIRPDSDRWLRHDCFRYQRPAHPDERKYRADQPRVPAGSPGGGQWVGDGGTGSQSVDDTRVISDLPDDRPAAGDQYAQNRGGSRWTSSSGRPLDVTPAQAARLAVARARADEAIARVR